MSGNAHLLLQFNELQDCIVNGFAVPEEFYRIGIDDDKDLLLELTGVKHLHLDGRASDVLVYLVETDETVIILLIAGHAYLQDYPKGGLLFGRLGYRLPYSI